MVEQTAIRTEFAEQTAVCTRVMYASPAMRTTHRLARLNVPVPAWMRAPGECPGMYALESAIDELAVAAGIDPVELRIRNESETEPGGGLPFSSRNLVACLREGARRFGWADRDPRPGIRREGRWLAGTGLAAATYPARRRPRGRRPGADDGFVVRIAAVDIGTGARTALAEIAAQALGTAGAVRVELGDSDLPHASLAGGSMGTRRWGSAVVRACEALLKTAGRQRGHRRRTWRPTPGLPGTRSAPSSRRCSWTPAPARCACRGCSACSPPAGSSTRHWPAPSSSGP